MNSRLPLKNFRFIFHDKGTTEVGNSLFAYAKGRMFDRWIDATLDAVRSNGYSTNDLIENPAYVIESLLRDELFVERDLVITDLTSSTVFECTNLSKAVNDYYKYAIIYNVTTGTKSWIAGNTGKTLTIADADAAMDDGNKFFLTNIQGDNKINEASFDVVGNTTNGLRNGWKFRSSINTEIDLSSLLDSLCYEARLIWWLSFNEYKIKSTFDLDASPDTWTKPLFDRNTQKYIANFGLTNIRLLYNDYRINYAYDYGSQEYKKTLFVSKSGYSSEITNGSTYQATCKSIYDNYGIINKYEYNLNWIYDDTTAEAFLDSIFAKYSKQRLHGYWGGWISDYLKYEPGDQVKINNTKFIPTGLNNSAVFMIDQNPIRPLPGNNIILFHLLEIS